MERPRRSSCGATAKPLPCSLKNPCSFLLPTKLILRTAELRSNVPRFDNERDARRVAKRLSRQKLEFPIAHDPDWTLRSEEHTSELQSLMRTSHAVFCLKKKKH